MVSFFLSYRSGSGDNTLARLLDTMLTARFGSDSVVRDDDSAFMSVGELWRRLSTSAALVVVVEPAAPGESAGSLESLPGLNHRMIATALTTPVPVVVVLVDGAELPPETRLPEALRALAGHRPRRVRTSSARSDLRDLVDGLAASLGPETTTTGRPVPLILSVEPMRWPVSPRSRRSSVAIVYSTSQGGLEVAAGDRTTVWQDPGLTARYETRYEVDVSDHSVVVDLRLPARGGTDHFTASVTVDFQVTDPAQVVRRGITDAMVLIRRFLLDSLQRITSAYDIDEMIEAEEAVNWLLGAHISIVDGVTILPRDAELSHDGWVGHHLREHAQGDLPQRAERLEQAEWGPPVPRASPELYADMLAEQGPSSSPPPGDDSAWRARATPPFTAPATSSPPDVSRAAERLLVARAPTQVPVGRDLSVEVRLVTEGRPVHPDAVAARMPSFLVADAGTPVTVTVHAPAGLHAEGPLQQTVLVVPDDDPDPIRFGFGARTPGLHRIDVTAWAGGTFLTEVSVEVSVADGGPFRDGPPKTTPLGAPQARPGEVTMEVRFDGNRYTFQLRSEAALFAPVVESVTNTPNAAVENAIRELQQLAGGGSRYSAAMIREVIRSAGIQLWSELVPADVRDQFWQVRGDMSAFTIATDHDVVPWELLHPLSVDRDNGFLVEQVPVVRRTYGQRRNATIGLRNPRFVVPPKAPTGAHEEIASIRAILGATDSEPITRADDLLALINSGSLGATHFACHNTFSADGSFIDMDGGRFRPTLLAEASIRRLLAESGPLVFINACRSAGVAPTYTRMLGWAQQFMSSGAGAFVGTLWAVRSDSSARFATAFYRSLADGATLGAAALAARVEQQDDPLDPTWLAYTVYGDPFATAAL
ncbi:CHAT domain-containing protein [Micromonospora sp. NPDC005215]|uniref:CHAT domain-containing protein n=1 Tax=Micromonospora sp. NPDC005215 TaxID=3157024 RepID=UPI0033AD3870